MREHKHFAVAETNGLTGEAPAHLHIAFGKVFKKDPQLQRAELRRSLA